MEPFEYFLRLQLLTKGFTKHFEVCLCQRIIIIIISLRLYNPVYNYSITVDFYIHQRFYFNKDGVCRIGECPKVTVYKYSQNI